MAEDDVEMRDGEDGPIRISVLSLTNEARNEHGLRHQDYHRYRRYCARKVERVRKIAGLQQQSKGSKKFSKKPISSELVSNSRYLEILLFDAERSWSYAMELKRDSTEEPRKRHHLIRKLKRAAQFAADLETVCQGVGADDQSTLDARAYASVMAGYVHLERQEWGPAMDRFAAARTIYAKMSSAGTSEQEVLCQSAIDAIDPNIRFCAYNLRIRGSTVSGKQTQQDIAQLLEVRSQASGDGKGLDILAAQVEEVLARSHHARAMEIHDIQWRDKTTTNRNTKFMEALVASQEVAAELDRIVAEGGPVAGPHKNLISDVATKRLSAFEKLIGAYWDATKIADSDIKEDAITTTKIKSSKSEENTASLQFAFSYVSYMRLKYTIDRVLLIMEITENRLSNPAANSFFVLAGDKKQPSRDDLVRLCDNILQSLNEMAELPSVSSDAVLQAIIASKVSLVKARRASHIGEILLDLSRFGEASALFGRSLEHLTLSKSELQRLSSLASRGAGVSTEDTAELGWIDFQQKAEEKRAVAGTLTAHAKAAMLAERSANVEAIGEQVRDIFLDGEGADKSQPMTQTDSAPVVQRLNEFIAELDVTNPHLADIPPKLQPVPCKPVFFDIAYNGVEYPLENIQRRLVGKERVSTTEEKKEFKESSSAGITGFLSGIWGRK
ncbi:signal recognition particle subunit srp68 [Phlyctochytrium planicorne]|nr:signal recognition particle subunit srp68 [Phlyctochytrium planicorne]